MSRFATRVRRAAQSARAVAGAPQVYPAGFEAVGEALERGENALVACAVVGRDLARDGADLGEALNGLKAAAARATGREPDFEATEALSRAWAEETLAFVHQVSCEDPLTGLAGPAHLRARLSEVYRVVEHTGGSAHRTHALVVVEAARPDLPDSFAHALWLVGVGEQIRRAFPTDETLSRVRDERLVVLTRRTPDLGVRVLRLHDLLLDHSGPGCRIWVEGLPRKGDAAAVLIDELIRC